MNENPDKTNQYNQYALFLIALMLMARVTVFIRQRSPLAYSAIDISAGIEILLVGLGAILVFVNPKLREAIAATRKSSSKSLINYYLLCLFSFVWSYNAPYTIFRAVEMIILIIMVFTAMAYYKDIYPAERAYLILSLIATLFGVIMQIKLFSWRISLQSLHTNQYSAIAAMAFVYCMGERFGSDIQRKRYMTKMAIIFGILTAIGTSATSNIAAFAGLILVLSLARTSKVPLVLLICLGSLLLYLSGNFIDMWRDILLPGKSEQEITSLTGRTYLWNNYLSLFWKQPIQGYGFGIISRLGSKFGMIVSTTSTHNGLLEVLLGTGFLGAFVFFIWVIRLLAEILQTFMKRVVGILGFFGALTVAMVNNMGRSMIGGAFDAPALMFLILLSLFVFHISVRTANHAYHAYLQENE